MFSRSPVLRISSGLVAMACSILVALDLLGLIPEPRPSLAESRFNLCRDLAGQAISAVDHSDFSAVRSLLLETARSEGDVDSAGLRTAEGRLLVATEGHEEAWEKQEDDAQTATQVAVPVFKNGKPWGQVEVRFADRTGIQSLTDVVNQPVILTLMCFSPFAFLAFWFYMKRILKHLDPTAVIPARVQTALNVMAEGVVLLDSDERIVLANDAFSSRVGRPSSSLLGAKLSSLDWRLPSDVETDRRFPWLEAQAHSKSTTGMRLILETKSHGVQSFMVNGAPILDGGGSAKGVIATFDDVTELQRTTMELQLANEMLESANQMLEKNQDEIRLQNEELELLARRDPLTDVSNRRFFMTTYEASFKKAQETGQQIACIMADIDHFKRVNDNHGHAMGDDVIKRVAEALKSTVRGTDSVCRYGGEEFCVVLVGAPTSAAAAVAERIRRKIEQPDFAPVPVTASLGVSSIEFAPKTFPELINQADEALYASKKGGRNRVTRYDEVASPR